MGFDQEEASGGAGRTDEASAYPERLGGNFGGNRSFPSDPLWPRSVYRSGRRRHLTVLNPYARMLLAGFGADRRHSDNIGAVS
jgi:hypothetical protein